MRPACPWLASWPAAVYVSATVLAVRGRHHDAPPLHVAAAVGAALQLYGQGDQIGVQFGRDHCHGQARVQQGSYPAQGHRAAPHHQGRFSPQFQKNRQQQTHAAKNSAPCRVRRPLPSGKIVDLDSIWRLLFLLIRQG